jgi:hypothetical protein
MRYALHFGMGLSLLLIGQYSLLLVLQFAFIFTFFKGKNILYLIYIPLMFFALLKLFASAFYLLYFFNLLFLYSFLYIYNYLLSLKELVLFTLYMIFTYGMYDYLDEDIYALYISSGLDDKVDHIFDEVALFLLLLHIFIFMILGYNKQKLFRK